jgi:hypothetical protein
MECVFKAGSSTRHGCQVLGLRKDQPGVVTLHVMSYVSSPHY